MKITIIIDSGNWINLREEIAQLEMRAFKIVNKSVYPILSWIGDKPTARSANGRILFTEFSKTLSVTADKNIWMRCARENTSAKIEIVLEDSE